MAENFIWVRTDIGLKKPIISQFSVSIDYLSFQQFEFDLLMIRTATSIAHITNAINQMSNLTVELSPCIDWNPSLDEIKFTFITYPSKTCLSRKHNSSNEKTKSFSSVLARKNKMLDSNRVDGVRFLQLQ